MKRVNIITIFILALLMLLSACSENGNTPSPNNSPPTSNESASPDSASVTATMADDWPAIPLDAWEYYYNAELQGIEIAKYKALPSILRVRIPDKIEDMPVVRIKSNAFERVGITDVYLPDTLVQIGLGAFRGSGLTSVNFPDSLKEIHGEAFRNCMGLTNVTLGSGTTKIMRDVFRDCTLLAEIEIPSSLQYIGLGSFRDTAFWNNQPDGLVYLDGWLLGYKGGDGDGHLLPSGTNSVVVSDGTIGIGEFALNGSGYYSGDGYNAALPDSLNVVGDYSIAGCESVTYKGVTYTSKENVLPQEFFELFVGNSHSNH